MLMFVSRYEERTTRAIHVHTYIYVIIAIGYRFYLFVRPEASQFEIDDF